MGSMVHRKNLVVEVTSSTNLVSNIGVGLFLSFWKQFSILQKIDIWIKRTPRINLETLKKDKYCNFHCVICPKGRMKLDEIEKMVS